MRSFFYKTSTKYLLNICNVRNVLLPQGLRDKRLYGLWRLRVCLTFNGSILQVQGSGSASDSGLSSPASPASSLDKHEASLRPQPLSEAKPRTPRPKSQFVPKHNKDNNIANRSVREGFKKKKSGNFPTQGGGLPISAPFPTFLYIF